MSHIQYKIGNKTRIVDLPKNYFVVNNDQSKFGDMYFNEMSNSFEWLDELNYSVSSNWFTILIRRKGS